MKNLFSLFLGAGLFVACTPTVQTPVIGSAQEPEGNTISVSQSTEADELCPHGGSLRQTGVDANENGILDEDEISQTDITCNGAPTPTSLVEINEEPPGDNCPHGGQKITSGTDTNDNGTLDENEVETIEYICNGGAGEPADNTLVEVEEEEAGNNCAHGGQKITNGTDTNDNGTLDEDEIDNTEYVCNGAPATNNLTNIEDEPMGDNCPHGGQKITSGADTNDNGTLDEDEIDNTEYVCNGEPAVNVLVNIVEEPTGDNCIHGGQKISSGTDRNANATLEEEEIENTEYVCNGAPATNNIIEVNHEPMGDNCSYGGQKIIWGVDANNDGLLENHETAGQRYVCNGQTGASGQSSEVVITEEAPGNNCPHGGQKVTLLQHFSSNAVPSNGEPSNAEPSSTEPSSDESANENEVISERYICNGASGQSSEVIIAEEPPGTNCPYGGQKVTLLVPPPHSDEAGNGGEIISVQYICNGEEAYNSLVGVKDEPVGDKCANGGKRIDSGLDTNRNNILDNEEVLGTEFLCNGENGQTSLVLSSDEPAGDNCSYGGKRLEQGFDENDNSVLDPEEIIPEQTLFFCHPNGAPMAHGATHAIPRDQTLNVNLQATDPNDEALSYAVLSGTQNGQLFIVMNSGSDVEEVLTIGTPYNSHHLIYKPNHAFVGSDSFTFKVNDGQLDSNLATVVINVVASPDAVYPVPMVFEPANGSEGVLSHATISAQFDHHINPATLSSETFLVTQNDLPVTGELVYDEVLRQVTFFPNAPLVPDTTYNITLTTGILGGDTTPLERDYVWSFHTIISDPLVPYQWHLHNTGQTGFGSLEATPGHDLNVPDSVLKGHSYTGEGVVVAVLDTGLEVGHEDLQENIIPQGSFNHINASTNPTNTCANNGDHGTSVAGIIASRGWNGLGGHGIAPYASLKGFNVLSSGTTNEGFLDSLGAGDYAADIDVINQSYGSNNTGQKELGADMEDQYAYGATHQRDGKGILYVKSAGNGFMDYEYYADLLGYAAAPCSRANDLGLACQNANMDPRNLLVENLVVGALNAQGVKTSYSTPGASLWISAPGGEYGYHTDYINPVNCSALGAANNTSTQYFFGPAIVSADQSSCNKGYTRNARNPFEVGATGVNYCDGAATETNEAGEQLYPWGTLCYSDNDCGEGGHCLHLDGLGIGESLNPQCNYTSIMNGTSAAGPMVAGALALLLEANPHLTWRDVRYILANTARKVDPNPEPASDGEEQELQTGEVHIELSDGVYIAEQGWVENAAGYSFHNWYGFGAMDVGAALAMAESYDASNPAVGAFRKTDWFRAPPEERPIPDGSAQGVEAKFHVPLDVIAESIQVRVSVYHRYLGDLGFELISPNGTRSVIFNAANGFNTGLMDGKTFTTHAFYGESAQGEWTLKVVDAFEGYEGALYDWSLRVHGHAVEGEPSTPVEVSNVTAVGQSQRVLLSFRMPADEHVRGYRVLRKAESPATGIDDEEAILIHAALTNPQDVIALDDSDVTEDYLAPERLPPVNGITYYYTIFTFDNFYNFSSGETIPGLPFREVVPAPVQVLAAEPGNNNVYLAWKVFGVQDSEDAPDGVIIVRKETTAPTGVDDPEAQVVLNEEINSEDYNNNGEYFMEHLDQEVTNGTGYYYSLYAYSNQNDPPTYSRGVSANSTLDTAPSTNEPSEHEPSQHEPIEREASEADLWYPPLIPNDNHTPMDPSFFVAEPGTNRIELYWNAPEEEGTELRLRRNGPVAGDTIVCPQQQQDGQALDITAASAHDHGFRLTDTDVLSGGLYCYALFTLDNEGNVSAGLQHVTQLLEAEEIPQVHNAALVRVRSAGYEALYAYGDRITLQWRNPFDATFDGLRIYRWNENNEDDDMILVSDLNLQTERGKVMDFHNISVNPEFTYGYGLVSYGTLETDESTEIESAMLVLTASPLPDTEIDGCVEFAYPAGATSCACDEGYVLNSAGNACVDAGWTCNSDWFNDGLVCHCGCGTHDPDCGEDYGFSDCQWDDCNGASCDPYPWDGCHDNNCCAENRSRVDPTDLRECRSVIDCNGDEYGNAAFDNCGTCDDDPTNDCVQDCAEVWGGNATYDVCGNCDDNVFNDCIPDCNGIWGGEATEDNCGTCDNDPENDCPMDCNGEENGDAVEDNCGDCDNDPSNDCIQDCAGQWGGSAVEDNCGTCDNDPSNDCTQDCTGEWGGEAVIDCNDLCDGPATLDNCGTCDDNSENDCIQDCNGEWGGNAQLDCADICGGTALEDNCGTCDDDPENDCVQDCTGEWGGEASWDNCWTCDDDPSNDCTQDCNGEWGGEATEDNCGNCDDNVFNDCTQDCNGEWGGEASWDNCLICDDDSTNDDDTCADGDGAETCLNAPVLSSAGGNLVGHFGMTNDYETYHITDNWFSGCTGSVGDGAAEVVYAISIPAKHLFTVSVSGGPEEADEVLYLLNTCPEDGLSFDGSIDNCVAGAQENYSSGTDGEILDYFNSSEEDQVYFLVVDARGSYSPTSADTFELAWSLEFIDVSGDGADTCLDAPFLFGGGGSLMGHFGTTNDYETKHITHNWRYSCTAGGADNSAGKEMVYAINIPADYELTVDVSAGPENANEVIYLLNTCPEDGIAFNFFRYNCVGGSNLNSESGPDGESFSYVNTGTEEQTYYLVIDASCGAGDEYCPQRSDGFGLQWDIQPHTGDPDPPLDGETCLNPIVLTESSGTTFGEYGQSDDYRADWTMTNNYYDGCSRGHDRDGPEVVYQIDIPAGKELMANVFGSSNNDPYLTDEVLYLLNTCPEDGVSFDASLENCVAGANKNNKDSLDGEVLYYTNLSEETETYFLVVDTRCSIESSHCPEFENGDFFLLDWEIQDPISHPTYELLDGSVGCTNAPALEGTSGSLQSHFGLSGNYYPSVINDDKYLCTAHGAAVPLGRDVSFAVEIPANKMFTATVLEGPEDTNEAVYLLDTCAGDNNDSFPAEENHCVAGSNQNTVWMSDGETFGYINETGDAHTYYFVVDANCPPLDDPGAHYCPYYGNFPYGNELDFFRMTWAILDHGQAPESWSCSGEQYGWDGVCDCGCGINDPDCGPHTTDDECEEDHCLEGSFNSDNPTQCDESP